MTETYAESIAELLYDKVVEIYLGDSYEEVTYADNSTSVHSALIGKVVSGSGDLLVINSIYIDAVTNEAKYGNMIYVNAYNIKAIVEIDGLGTYRDAIHSANDAAKYVPGGNPNRSRR